MTGTELAGHEWDAEAYHRLSEPQYTLAMRLLAALPLRGDETVIDAGCGTGRLAQALLQRLPTGCVIAVDLSQNMLDKVATTLGPMFGPRLCCVRADLHDFCAPDIADGVFSSMAVHFIADRARTFRNFAASLRPGGWLALQFVAEQAQTAPFFARLRDVMRSAPYAAAIGDWRPDFYPGNRIQTRRDLAAAGFVDITVRFDAVDMRMAPRDRVAMLRTVALREPLARLPNDAMRAAFLRDIEHAVETQEMDTSEEPVRYLICRARRPVQQ